MAAVPATMSFISLSVTPCFYQTNLSSQHILDFTTMLAEALLAAPDVLEGLCAAGPRGRGAGAEHCGDGASDLKASM